MKLRAAILFTLVAVGLGLVVLVPPAEPAWACSCAFGPAQWDEQADLIVVGTVTEVTDTTVQLAVESVEKGSHRAGDPLRLNAWRGSGAGCGYDFHAGTRYRVNSRAGSTGLCSGISQLPATTSAPVAAPTPVQAAPASTETASRWWLAAGAVLTALAAGLVAVVLRRRRRPAGPGVGPAS